MSTPMFIDPVSKNTPATLLDRIKEEFNMKYDADIARAIHTTPDEISRIRNNKDKIGAVFLLQVHDFTKWPVAVIRERAGIVGP